jgi:hypothetical protein
MFVFKAGLTSLVLLSSVVLAQQPDPDQPAVTAAPTTTHTAQTTNNTTACSAAGLRARGTAYCGNAFAGWTDLSSPAGSATQPLTQPHNPAVGGAWNISKGRGTQAGDVHSLLYPGHTTKVLAETQLWFCNGSGGSTVTVDGQVLTGAVMDWSGDANTCKSGTGAYKDNAPFASACGAGPKNVDLASRRLASAMTTRHPAMTHMVMYDHSAYKFNQCDDKDTFQPQCVQNKMIADLNVLASNWFTSPNYLRVNNRPVVAFFLDETAGVATFSQCSASAPCHLTGSFTCTSPSGCWAALWDGIRSNFVNHGVNPYMIFRHNHTHRQSDGGFTWVLRPPPPPTPTATTASAASRPAVTRSPAPPAATRPAPTAASRSPAGRPPRGTSSSPPQAGSPAR